MPTPEDLASFAAEMAAEKPHVRKVIEDVRLFDGLMEHVGWKRLADKVRGGRERFLAGLVTRQMSGQVVSQREIDYYRGFYEGAQWVIGIPENAEVSLEAAAREAWRITQIELAKRTEESSAYLNDPTGGE